ncbi:hypothetical protein PENSPDRAFT_747526 [Peniophora sp. CONT]|nr:hypothetical protein PENSPDRAFT_747526 [Peniophora sp. CONT]
MATSAATPISIPRNPHQQERAQASLDVADAFDGGTSDSALPEDQFWLRYLVDAEKYDKVLADGWKGDTDGILIFTGLFAATVAAFLVESYQLLSPDSADVSAALLAQISSQLVLLSNGTAAPIQALPTFEVPHYAVTLNILWFLSLLLSLMSALASTLMQQWTRRYLRATQHRGPARKRGPVHVFLHRGTRRFKLTLVVDCIVWLLHASVFLFIAGLLVFLFMLDETIAFAALAIIAAGSGVYIFFTVLPLAFHDCPYNTPLTPSLRAVVATIYAMLYVGAVAASRVVTFVSPGSRMHHALKPYAFTVLKNRLKTSLRTIYLSPKTLHTTCALQKSDARVSYALHQALKNADEPQELEEFFDGLLPLLSSPLVSDKVAIVRYLFDEEGLSRRLQELFLSCAAGIHAHFKRDLTLTPARRARRVYILLSRSKDLMVILFGSGTARYRTFHEIQYNITVWMRLLQDDDPAVSLLARCFFSELRMSLLDAVSGRRTVPRSPHMGSIQVSANSPSRDPGVDLLNLLFFRHFGVQSTYLRHGHVYNFVGFVYDMLRIAPPRSIDTTLREYGPLWRTLLKSLEAQAIAHVPPHDSDAYQAFWWMLSDVGVEDLLPRPEPLPPRDEERQKPTSILHMVHPDIMDSLRAVARALHPPLATAVSSEDIQVRPLR